MTMLGNGSGPAPMPRGVTADKVARDKHRAIVEELLAHVTGQHACQHAEQYVQAVLQEAVAAQAAVTPETFGPNGPQKEVRVDGAQILGEPRHRRQLQRFHRAHSHDYDGATSIKALHTWDADVADTIMEG